MYELARPHRNEALPYWWGINDQGLPQNHSFWINVTLSWDINSDINIATAKVISAMEYILRFEDTCHDS